jgi:hypothetical protein
MRRDIMVIGGAEATWREGKHPERESHKCTELATIAEEPKNDIKP